MIETPRIKVCGLTRAQDAHDCARLGVDAIGLVFYPDSPRHVTLEQARAVVAALPPFVSVVALFVDPAPAQVEAVLAAVPVDMLQFHGDESPDFCRAFQRPYLKAVRVRPGLDLLDYAGRHAGARGLLCDAFVPGQAGGTGATFDWRLLPPALPLPLILSGGLDPENVTDAIRRVRPAAVDVSSGVETAKGIKDAAKIAAFISGVHDASV
ncbi:phosphoribosylanthranilate isomerase [Microvirgula aerodenitrificans]|uniref:N-(5'-phosphoribosyl)anthranilate isomerase n=1 Tax=Microvirgula aerodenitrificans TaxID=57480 RepID=A0A2S0PC58_9NEIS|nr:phosphoribosylanthranilate isomerase [Microvirgula aerodenitrificans]AVY94968.1 phosphoribosylanthranilate isomerase [Microvirgula aerodenitrificans]